jgi:hypothetical protein
VPAAAVIPAPIAYIKIVAVKTLVVGYLSGSFRWGPSVSTRNFSGHLFSQGGCPSLGDHHC